MPKHLLRQSASFVLSSFLVTLLFGRTREMATSAISVVYIGSI
jgi:hypothetical protein